LLQRITSDLPVNQEQSRSLPIGDSLFLIRALPRMLEARFSVSAFYLSDLLFTVSVNKDRAFLSRFLE
jgi:hypothetical protein